MFAKWQQRWPAYTVAVAQLKPSGGKHVDKATAFWTTPGMAGLMIALALDPPWPVFLAFFLITGLGLLVDRNMKKMLPRQRD